MALVLVLSINSFSSISGCLSLWLRDHCDGDGPWRDQLANGRNNERIVAGVSFLWGVVVFVAREAEPSMRIPTPARWPFWHHSGLNARSVIFSRAWIFH